MSNEDADVSHLEQCPCGRARAGCEFHDPALQPVVYDRVQGRLVIGASCPLHWLLRWGIVPSALAEDDARTAASGGVSQFAWECLDCHHQWGASSVMAYADPKWCPKCTGAIA